MIPCDTVLHCLVYAVSYFTSSSRAVLPIPAVVVPPALNTNFTVGDNPEL